MDWFRSRNDLDDERVLIGVTAGVLWFVGWIDWSKVSVNRHAVASGSLMPFLGVALWLTGGADSYLKPIFILVLLHVAYFFRPRIAVLLVLELIAVAASPGLYDHDMQHDAPAVFLAFAVAALVLTVILRLLKNRLVKAEAFQREMALRDSLTGLVNRRGFDEALHTAVAARGHVEHGRRDGDAAPGFALIVFDLDRFKSVNDTAGHPAGDRLLRAVAAGGAAIVRPTDTFARIGGDEFAVIAPGAGVVGASRLAEELLAAVHAAGAQATLAFAVAPEDGEDGDALLRTADRRLYEGKKLLSAGAPAS